jgi:predicted unusual protein kinase regulating ubiquinone biosynthesis (AarF/ABC1/UbiB family)
MLTLIHNKNNEIESNAEIVGKIEYLYFSFRFYSYLSYIKIMLYFCNLDDMYDYLLNILKMGGPVFIKIGQNLANKNNIDSKLKQKLLVLQENNFSKDNLAVLKDIDIDKIDKNPIAAGSIASVYQGVYNGKKCIIKVTHPDIFKRTIISINLFESIRSYFSDHSWFSTFNQLVEFSQTYKEILDQTNFNNEVNNINLFKKNFKDFSDIIVIPDVYYNNNNVIIESYEDGLSFVNFIKTFPEKKKEASHVLHCCFYKMFFDNYIHADLHSSNIRFRINKNDNVQLILLDFGLVSTIDEQKIYADFINVYKKNIFVPDYKKFIKLLKKVNINEDANLEQFEKELIEISEKSDLSSMLNGITTDKNYKYKKKDDLDNIITKSMNTALKNNLKFKDYIFNICNGFILLEDYRYLISEDKSDFHERFDYAEEKGFIKNMKDSGSKMLKKQ